MNAAPTVARAGIDDADVEEFIRGHFADMRPVVADAHQYALRFSELFAPGKTLWVARVDGRVAGTAALSRLSDDAAELKSMRTDPEMRGRGIARTLLRHVVSVARSEGYEVLYLETGTVEFFAPARALYASAGFKRRGPYGDYSDLPTSYFMELELSMRE